MNPFTLFFGRLVELLGAEIAAQVVRQFAGQTLQFPITDYYGFSSDAPILGADFEPSSKDRIGQPLQNEPLRLSGLANATGAARLLTLAHELGRSSQALQRHAGLLEQARLTVLSEIESRQSELVGS
jgi:hypothetical protein